MSWQVVPLGLNGYLPTYGRHTTSFLLLAGPEAILLDAGTGIARLADPEVRERIAACDTLNVVLSHYHVDHVVGLFYLPAFLGKQKVRIFGPSPPLTEAHPWEALERLLTPPLSPSSVTGPFHDLDVLALTGEPLGIGEVRLTVWPQQHPGGSIGMRFDNRLAYMTDLATDPDLGDRVRGVDLLLHELWLTNEEAERDPEKLAIHSHLAGVAEFARAAGVRRLMPIHHHPSRSPRDLRRLCAQLQAASGIEVVVPEEGRACMLDG